jgi:predicted outer membrane protein
MLVDDHTKAGEELKGIISTIGYAPDKTGPDQKAVKALSGRSADRFDREFAEKMVGMHEKDVKLFKRQAEKVTTRS